MSFDNYTDLCKYYNNQDVKYFYPQQIPHETL